MLKVRQKVNKPGSGMRLIRNEPFACKRTITSLIHPVKPNPMLTHPLNLNSCVMGDSRVFLSALKHRVR